MLVPGSFQIDGYAHHLAFFYRSVFWVAYSRPGVGVLPPLDLSVIADLIPPDHRNVYLSRLEGCLSVAYVIGPVIGAFLSQISLHFPFYAASAIATLATISALLFLKESNPLVVDEEGNRRPKKLQSVFSRFSLTHSDEDKREGSETASHVADDHVLRRGVLRALVAQRLRLALRHLPEGQVQHQVLAVLVVASPYVHLQHHGRSAVAVVRRRAYAGVPVDGGEAEHPHSLHGRHGSRDHVLLLHRHVRLEDHAGLHDLVLHSLGGIRQRLARLGVHSECIGLTGG